MVACFIYGLGARLIFGVTCCVLVFLSLLWEFAISWA